jgi:hypothetical protein
VHVHSTRFQQLEAYISSTLEAYRIPTIRNLSSIAPRATSLELGEGKKAQQRFSGCDLMIFFVEACPWAQSLSLYPSMQVASVHGVDNFAPSLHVAACVGCTRVLYM